MFNMEENAFIIFYTVNLKSQSIRLSTLLSSFVIEFLLKNIVTCSCVCLFLTN